MWIPIIVALALLAVLVVSLWYALVLMARRLSGRLDKHLEFLEQAKASLLRADKEMRDIREQLARHEIRLDSSNAQKSSVTRRLEEDRVQIQALQDNARARQNEDRELEARVKYAETAILGLADRLTLEIKRISENDQILEGRTNTLLKELNATRATVNKIMMGFLSSVAKSRKPSRRKR